MLAPDGDAYFVDLERRLGWSRRVGSLAELEAWIASGGVPRGADTLDLIAHSATADRLLVLGPDLIDIRRPTVRDAFARMAPALQRDGIRVLRLLGCGTATRDEGQRTLAGLAFALAPVKVFGTRDAVPPWAFDGHGLCVDDEDLLVRAVTRPISGARRIASPG